MSDPILRRFLVDNNAVSGIGFQRRSSSTFRSRACLPSEVCFEARGAADYANFKHQLFPTTARVLEILKEVMKTVDPEDRDLIDLYHNEGGADPLLVACALAAKEESDGGLFALEWTIVTNDKAVTALASKFGVDTLSVSEFADLIDSFDDK